jgi:hypothetical protein
MRKNVLAICILFTPTVASASEDRASVWHALTAVKASPGGVRMGRRRAAVGFSLEE